MTEETRPTPFFGGELDGQWVDVVKGATGYTQGDDSYGVHWVIPANDPESANVNSGAIWFAVTPEREATITCVEVVAAYTKRLSYLMANTGFRPPLTESDPSESIVFTVGAFQGWES